MTGPSTPGATAAGVEERRTRDARKASSELVGCWTRFHAGRVLFLVPASLRTAGGLRTAGHMLPALRALLPGAQYLRFAGLRSRTGRLSAASSGGTMATVLQPANGLLPVTAHLLLGLVLPELGANESLLHDLVSLVVIVPPSQISIAACQRQAGEPQSGKSSNQNTRRPIDRRV